MRVVGRVSVSALCVLVGAGCATRQPAHVTLPAAVSPPAVVAAPEAAGPRDVVLGTSVKGEPIRCFVFGGNADASVATLVIAAIHGDEPSATYVGRKLVDHLREHPQDAGGDSVAVIPLANPDGVVARTRTNANGVDCNRNFPASNWRPTRPGRNFTGPASASEPETRAILRAVETLRPARVISIHSPFRCNNYDGPPAARALAELMSRHNRYPVQPTVGYATPGSFGTWAGVDRGIPVVTLELPPPYAPPGRAWQENREALLAAIHAPRP